MGHKKNYAKYFYKGLNQRYVALSHMAKALDKLLENSQFERTTAGKSFLGQPIELLQWGLGPKRIFIWAQMHGNEATGALALLDFISYLNSNEAQVFYKKISLQIIPQLNPDGANSFIRRNAQGIDINRDAVAHESPEMRVFQKVLKGFKPHWCFNLHDQRSIFSVREKPATLSFLAASANAHKTKNSTQQKAMQLIAALHNRIKSELPGQFGRYNDEFYPNALGDNLHAAGTPCVLIESGAHPKDPTRLVARRLNFLALADALALISTGEWEQGQIENYLALPNNKQAYRDMILRQCFVYNLSGPPSFFDIALTAVEEVVDKKYNKYFEINDVGKLTHLLGYEEYKGAEVLNVVNLKIGNKAHFEIRGSEIALRFEEGQWVKNESEP